MGTHEFHPHPFLSQENKLPYCVKQIHMYNKAKHSVEPHETRQ